MNTVGFLLTLLTVLFRDVFLVVDLVTDDVVVVFPALVQNVILLS